MKTKGIIIKKAALISLSMMFALLSLSSCSADNSKTPQDTEETGTNGEYTFIHSGQKLTNKVSSIKLGDKEFDLSLDFEGFKAIFGDEMTVWYSKDTVDDFNDANDENYIYDNYIYASVVQNGVFTADLGFIYNESTKKYDFLSVQTVTSYNFSGHNISYTENGEVKIKDFPVETDKVYFSFDSLTTGTTTKKQIDDMLGEGEIFEHSDKGYIMETCYFDDYKTVFYYDNSEIFKGIFIFVDTDRYITKAAS